MEPLSSVHKLVVWLCLCWSDNSIDIKQKTAYIAATFSLIASQLYSFFTSVAFTVKLVATVDLEHSLFACVITMNRTNMLYTFVIAYFLRQKIPKIFEHLSEIYDSCKLHFFLLWSI